MAGSPSAWRRANSRPPASTAARSTKAAPPAWSGGALQRPPTDAEHEWRSAQWRTLWRIAGMLGMALLAVLLWSPGVVQQALERGATWHPALQPAPQVWPRLYPWIQWLGVLALLAALGDLIVSVRRLQRQRRWRHQQRMATLLIEPMADAVWTPLAMVDLWHALHQALRLGRHPPGCAPCLALVISGASHGRAQLAVRVPQDPIPTWGVSWAQVMRQELEGRFPGLSVRFPDPTDPLAGDDLARALTAAATADPPGVVAWGDAVVLRSDGAPLRDLSQFDGDPMGPLAKATDVRPGVQYAAYEILVRAADDRRWRQGVRGYAAHVQIRQPVDDLTAHEALVRYAETAAFDVVVRCLAIAETPAQAQETVRRMRAALEQFSRRTRGRLQRLQPPLLDRLAAPPDGISVMDLRLRAAHPWPRRIPLAISAVAALSGGGLALLGMLLSWPWWPWRPWVLPPLPGGLQASIPAAPWLALLIGMSALTFSVTWSILRQIDPVQRQQRQIGRRALLVAHAHRPVWPGFPWPALAPYRRRSLVSAYDLAALWHPPDFSVAPLIVCRTIPWLPSPSIAFLAGDEAAAAVRGTPLPEPGSPQELGRRRIGLAIADRPDGRPHLIGPTVFDLRKGMECLGPMGAGKSSFIEVLVYELARVGSGCIVIDAKGDLADRLVSILPPSSHDRIIFVDLTAPRVPCLNPLDRRMLQDGVSIPQIVGQVEQLFARMSPETWPESAGMQQFARMGLRAILEGEPTPTLLHLDRFYASLTYREQVLSRVANPNVREFWRDEYPKMDPRLRVSMDSFRRRLQHFITDPIVQHLFCQPDSTLYLPEVMDARKILIFKLVPEVLSEALAQIIATALFAALRVAVFARQQRCPDPQRRWDCPLIIDEVQKFIDAEHPNDAETFFTQTRSLGVGIIGAHQGLYQYSDAVRSAAVQSLGSLVILGPIKEDARMLCDAYAETGLTEAHFAALRAREELLIRFPVMDRDCGLMCARPRPRPEGTVMDPEERAALLRHAAHAPFRTAIPPVNDPADAPLDDLLRAAWDLADQAGALRAADQIVAAMVAQAGWTAWREMLERLASRCVTYQRYRAAALRRRPEDLPDAATRLRELSALEYGVDPLISALRTQTLARAYPATSDSGGARARSSVSRSTWPWDDHGALSVAPPPSAPPPAPSPGNAPPPSAPPPAPSPGNAPPPSAPPPAPSPGNAPPPASPRMGAHGNDAAADVDWFDLPLHRA